MERLMAKEWLRRYIEDEFVKEGYMDLIPEELLVVDWKRAATYDVGRLDASWIHHDRMQHLLVHDIGFDHTLALRLVDPAIRPIMARVLDLPMLTSHCCSGHVNAENRIARNSWNCYFMVVFRDRAFASEFIALVRTELSEAPLGPIEISGSHARTYGVSDNLLPVDLCVELELPVAFSVAIDRRRRGTHLLEIWKRVAAVLNHFDGKGGFEVPLELFRERVPVLTGERKVALFHDVLTDLFPDRTF